jgi:DNA-binding ferritin-like protein
MKRAMRSLAQHFGAGPGAPLATLVACLRAVYQIHQSNHWLAKGTWYYGDHLLYQRLYEAILPEIDGVAERAVGMGASEMMASLPQMQQTLAFCQMFCEEPARGSTPYALTGKHDPNAMASRSLQAELFLVGLVEEVEGIAGTTPGTSNLLQGIADTHEGHIYLLNQRLAHT